MSKLVGLILTSMVITACQTSPVMNTQNRKVASNDFYSLTVQQQRVQFPRQNQQAIVGSLKNIILDATEGRCGEGTTGVEWKLCHGLVTAFQGGDCGQFENKQSFSMCMAYKKIPGGNYQKRHAKLESLLNSAEVDSSDGVCGETSDEDSIGLCNEIVGASVNVCRGDCNLGCHALRALNSSNTGAAGGDAAIRR